MANRVGQQLDNYRLVRLLGVGGFGEVYLAERIHRNIQVAIKILPSLAQENLPAFLREVRTLLRLRHPHIVQILDFSVETSHPFIVMEYAPNGTLRTRHPKGTRVPLDAVVIYVQQVASALQYAHDESLIHRDVKPENMLLGTQNQVLLSDFGIATIAHRTSSQSAETMAGTILYMAPEQIQAHPRPASDQYSLGVVVYEWLCGIPPFQGTLTEAAVKHATLPPPSLREHIPTISPEVEQVVMTALAKDPKQRFGSVQAFAHALAAASSLLKTKEQWLAEGVAHYDAGRYEAALMAYDQALRLDPGYASAYHNRGLAHIALRQYDRAIADYNRALELTPENVTVRLNRGEVYRLSRRAAIMGIGGAVGLAVASSGLTWLLFPRTSTPRRTLPPTHAAGYDSNYLYKKSITIDYGKVSGGSNLSNFPVLISLPANSDLRTAANGGYVQNSNGYDIIFTDSTETVKLDHEVEKYNASTGEIEMWVRIPTLSASTDTVIYMYFGNSRISSSQEKKTEVWDSYYLGVWHLKETKGQHNDSTSNGNNSSSVSVTTQGSATGQIDGADSFTGSDGGGAGNNVTITGLLGSLSSITLSGWGNSTTRGTGGSELISLGDHVTIRLDDTFNPQGTQGYYFDGSTWRHTGISTTYAGTGWHYFTYVIDGSGHTQTFYVDGVQQAQTTNTQAISYAGLGSNTMIGHHANGSNGFNFTGIIDELRVSNIARSAGWITTEYSNQSSPPTFYRVSSLISR